MDILRRLWSSTDGASSAEYALIIAIIGTGIAAAAFALGESIAQSFEGTGEEVMTCGGTC